MPYLRRRQPEMLAENPAEVGIIFEAIGCHQSIERQWWLALIFKMGVTGLQTTLTDMGGDSTIRLENFIEFTPRYLENTRQTVNIQVWIVKVALHIRPDAMVERGVVHPWGRSTRASRVARDGIGIVLGNF